MLYIEFRGCFKKSNTCEKALTKMIPWGVQAERTKNIL